MKNVLDKLTSVGADTSTINFILKVLALFLFVAGLGIISIMIIEAVRSQTVNPALIAILVVIVTIVSGLITVSSTTTHINGTAAQSAQASTDSQLANAKQITDIVAQIVSATLATQKQANVNLQTTTTVPDASTIATQENTLATQENTSVIAKKELHNG